MGARSPPGEESKRLDWIGRLPGAPRWLQRAVMEEGGRNLCRRMKEHWQIESVKVKGLLVFKYSTFFMLFFICICFLFCQTRRFLNHESCLLSRSHTFAIIVILDLKINQLNQRSLNQR